MIRWFVAHLAYLCPAPCDAVEAAGADVQVLFTSESQIIVK